MIDPKDEKRRAAFPAAEAAGIGTPAGCAAAAAYFSGGSLAPPDLPVVPPRRHVTGGLVAAALTLAAVIKQPEKAPEKHAAFLRTGRGGRRGSTSLAAGRPGTVRDPTREGGSAHGAARRPRHRHARLPDGHPGVPPIPHVGGPILPPGARPS